MALDLGCSARIISGHYSISLLEKKSVFFAKVAYSFKDSCSQKLYFANSIFFPCSPLESTVENCLILFICYRYKVFGRENFINPSSNAPRNETSQPPNAERELDSRGRLRQRSLCGTLFSSTTSKNTGVLKWLRQRSTHMTMFIAWHYSTVQYELKTLC